MKAWLKSESPLEAMDCNTSDPEYAAKRRVELESRAAAQHTIVNVKDNTGTITQYMVTTRFEVSSVEAIKIVRVYE